MKMYTVRKTVIAVIMALLLCVLPLSLFGCKDGDLDRDREQGQGHLTVCYFVSEGSRSLHTPYDGVFDSFRQKYPEIELHVEEQRHGGWEEYQSKIQTLIMSGNGPDVFLFSDRAFLNLGKVMESGAFADLTPFMEADEEYKAENYFESVLAAGQHGGKQYVLPLFFSPEYKITTGSALKASGVNLEGCNTFDGYVKELAAFLDRSDGNMLISDNKGEADKEAFAQFFDKLTELDDTQAGIISPLFYDTAVNFARVYKALPQSPNSVKPFLDVKEKLTTGQMVFYDTGINIEEAGAVAAVEPPILLPMRTISGEVSAQIKSYAAISSNSKNKEGGYAFLRELLMPVLQEGDQLLYVPVSREAAEKNLQIRMERTLSYVNGEYTVMPDLELAMPEEEFWESYRDMLNSPINAKTDYGAIDIVSKEMESFFEGKKGLDECIENAYDRLEIYLSE